MYRGVPLLSDDRALRRVLLAAMALGFLALIGAGLAAWKNVERTAGYGALVDHSYAVRAAIARLEVALERSETARRGYLLTGRPDFADTFRRTNADLGPALAAIQSLTYDNPTQTRDVTRIRDRLEQVSREREMSIELTAAGDRTFAQTLFDRGASIVAVRAIRARLAAMDAREGALLEVRAAEQRAGASAFVATLAAAGLLVMVVAAVSLLTVLRFTRELGQSRARLQELADSLEDQVQDRTRDLARANEEIQRFAYIVSHDLRSPLVNVMGFTAELEAGQRTLAALVDRLDSDAPDWLDDDARLAAREDLPEAIGFIRTSTAKMDRLINAILKLSREGRRTIAPEPLDVAGVVDTIRDTLQHRLDEVGGSIVVQRPLPEITSDRLAIEQVFANVIENAVKYRSPDRPIVVTVSGRVEGTRAIFAISDNGRGIDPRDHARVFDLFRRSGAQDQPGEGIGLAHVRALCYRLGGTIDVASELGNGATFRINLPTRYQESLSA